MIAWLTALLRDPVDLSPSSARIAAMLCVLSGCGIAIAGMVLNRDQPATVAALLGGGAASFLTRNKAAP
jgi:hypothetical protein